MHCVQLKKCKSNRVVFSGTSSSTTKKNKAENISNACKKKTGVNVDDNVGKCATLNGLLGAS